MTLFETKKHQYNDDEVKSVIQKTIRRGDEEGSLFFALELAHESKPSFEWLRNRLKIIAYEDIGLANPDFVLRISKAVDDMVLLYESNNEEWETSLAYVILLLCRSPKSRIANHFKVYVKSCWEDDTGRFNIDIPDYALDYHTTKGNKLGRIKHSRKGIDHFIKAGEKLINETIEIEDIYKKKAHRVWREKLPSEKEIINP
jgi:replication-associated recombination protein RarA